MGQTFLVEIGCEELPPKALLKLSQAFTNGIEQGLKQAQLNYGEIRDFASPRRLAVMIADLSEKQRDQVIERLGPGVNAAFDADGKPTPACLGFAKSCGVEVEHLEHLETDKGIRLAYHQEKPGLDATTLLPDIVNQSLQALPIPKRMRWGNVDTEFVRPVHWLLMLWGDQVLDCTLLGCRAGNITYGHRFLAPEAITINHPLEYLQKLKAEGKVIADFAERSMLILNQTNQAVENLGGQALIDENLLQEVTAIVEWPVALAVGFDQSFLQVPSEALISEMQGHQKCFPVMDEDKKLLPYFIAISNIESKNPQQVINGNEKVMTARLSDARFFYENDLKNTLADYRQRLHHVLFKEKLGTLFDKAERIAKLAGFIATQLNSSEALAQQAGQLCKADLMSDMVGEFPELQGIMGSYYAEHEGLPQEVADTMQEHYLPRFSGDNLPSSNTGCAVALADRIDTIVGIFGLNQAPTGDKDPFALRRAALGILRIMIEKHLSLDLHQLIQYANDNYADLPNQNTIADSFAFILDRLRSWYGEQGVTSDVFAAVMAKQPHSPLDFQHRIDAVSQFKHLPESSALAAANKRVSKLLIKEGKEDITRDIQATLLESDDEKNLAELIIAKKQVVDPLYQKAEYTQALTELASLREPVDKFFENVMVMVDDDKIRDNRLALLANLRDLFLHVADISELQ